MSCTNTAQHVLVRILKCTSLLKYVHLYEYTSTNQISPSWLLKYDCKKTAPKEHLGQTCPAHERFLSRWQSNHHPQGEEKKKAQRQIVVADSPGA
jgi:hypothetical protein